MKNFLIKIWNEFEDALFVNFKCMFCGRETPNESLVCDKCASEVTFINGFVCDHCGAQAFGREVMCPACRGKNYKFDSHRSCIIYGDLSSRAVKALKYSGKLYLAEPIARFMYAVNKELFENADAITFVPMTKSKLASRGYNHMEEVAKVLSKISKIPVLECFNKIKETEDQASLNYDKRTKNLKGSFVVIDDNKDMIRGKKILLVDDVFTTGSTANECSKLLLKAKAKSVNVATFLKTDPFAEDDFEI